MITKKSFILLLLLFSSWIYSQKYSYDTIWIRDNLGKFQPIPQKDTLEIKHDSIYILSEYIKINSSRIIFNNKGNSLGRLYNCSYDLDLYTILHTVNNELYLYLPNQDMIKFILRKINEE